MTAYRLLVGMIALAVLIAGWLLVPRREEQVAMLTRDGYYDMASQELSSLQVGDAQHPRVLMQAHLLKEIQGDVVGALQDLDAFLAIRPGDLAARKRQAVFLLQTGQLDRYLSTLAMLAVAQPTTERILQLLALYRLHGRFDDELALLRQQAGKRPEDHVHLQRLGALLAERHEWLDAERWLRLAARSAPADDHEGRLLLLDVLIQNKRGSDIAKQPLAWMKAWRSPYLTGRLITKLAEAGLGAPAAELARASVDLMPASAFEIAGVLTQKGQPAVALEMLARWVAGEANPSRKDLRDFVYACGRAGDAAMPLRKLLEFVRIGAPPLLQGDLAEELAQAYGKGILASIRPLLSMEVLRAKPLLGADLALFEGNGQLARWFLSQADLSGMPPAQRTEWLALLQKTEPPSTVFNRLHQLWLDKRLPPELVRLFADEARRMGRLRLHHEIWTSLGR